MYVYEWLKKLDETYSDEYFNGEIITENSIHFSTATNINSDYLLESVSNMNSYSNLNFENKSPNIFLPKFIFNNRPIQTPKDPSRVGTLNDNRVLNLINDYRKKRSETSLSLHSITKTDVKSSNKSRKLSESWLKVEEINQKLILREKLKKARIKNDLLRTRIKLDLFVL